MLANNQYCLYCCLRNKKQKLLFVFVIVKYLVFSGGSFRNGVNCDTDDCIIAFAQAGLRSIKISP